MAKQLCYSENYRSTPTLFFTPVYEGLAQLRIFCLGVVTLFRIYGMVGVKIQTRFHWLIQILLETSWSRLFCRDIFIFRFKLCYIFLPEIIITY